MVIADDKSRFVAFSSASLASSSDSFVVASLSSDLYPEIWALLGVQINQRLV
jgi:hypothetical protein